MGDGKFLVTESPLGRLYVYWEEYNTRMFLHIRYWYLDKASDEWKPSKKGIAIAEHNVQGVLKGLRENLETRAKEQVAVNG